MKINSRVIFLVMLTLLAGGTQAVTVYKWTDANGSIHYDDHSRADVNSVQLKISDFQPSDQGAALKNLETDKQKIAADAEALENKKIMALKKLKEKDDQKQQAARCDQEHQDLQKLNEHHRILEMPPGGAPVVLSEEERQAKIKETQKYLDQYCTNISVASKRKKPVNGI